MQKLINATALAALKGPALVTLFNKLVDDNALDLEGYKAVNKFADRATAEKRVDGLLVKLGLEITEVVDGVPTVKMTRKAAEQDALMNGLVARDPSPAAQEVLNAPEPKAQKERKRRGFRFVFPKKNEIKSHREGTNRAKLVELMSRPEGASFQELRDATGWDEKTCYEGTRLVHYYLGYGMRQDEEGRIYLVK